MFSVVVGSPSPAALSIPPENDITPPFLVPPVSVTLPPMPLPTLPEPTSTSPPFPSPALLSPTSSPKSNIPPPLISSPSPAATVISSQPPLMNDNPTPNPIVTINPPPITTPRSSFSPTSTPPPPTSPPPPLPQNPTPPLSPTTTTPRTPSHSSSLPSPVPVVQDPVQVPVPPSKSKSKNTPPATNHPHIIRVHDRPIFPPPLQASAPSSSSPAPENPPPAAGDMPLTAEPSSQLPELPVQGQGGGVANGRPPPSVLPIGVDSTGLASRSAPSPSSRVSPGILVGLSVGVLLLVFLSLFGILLVFFNKKKPKLGNGDIVEGESKISSLPRYSTNNAASSLGAHRHHKIPFTAHHNINAVTSFPNNASPSTLEPTSSNPPMPMAFSVGTFTYDDLLAATSGFSPSNLLGQGGFGYVHKGVLPSGKEVAVKQLILGGHQGDREFQAEVDTISQVHHKHLVSLVGYCIAGDMRLLVYDFVPNNNLEFHLHGKDQPVMEWSTRLKVAIGSAKGLAYLHEDCNPAIIHRDIKAANILLHFNCEPKVSDFGLAKIFSNTSSSVTHVTTRVMGTFGYLAPEYASSGKLTDKSDVYSYGVMLLELITGRPPITTCESETNGSLVNWARPLLSQAIEGGDFSTLVDPRLQNNYNANKMASMIACAAACVRLSAWRRPRMSQVVRALEGDLSPSDLDDGVRPGQSSVHFPYESLGFDGRRYMEEMKKFKKTLASNGYNTSTGGNSDNTSDYGVNPSISSPDSQISQSNKPSEGY